MSLQIQLSLAALLFMSTSVLGCIESCTQQFSFDMQAALTGDVAIATDLSCTAISNHIQCLRAVEMQCSMNTNFQRLHQATLTDSLQKYDQFCQPGSNMQDVANCGGQFMVCNEKLNNTFNVAISTFDLQKACASLNNYSQCVENLISLPNCGQLSTHAMKTVKMLMSHYGPSCQGDMAKQGENIASCMNRTMQCYDTFQGTFSLAVNSMDMPKMCQSLDKYTTCVEDLRSDQTCTQYIDNALVNIGLLRSQHRVACGPVKPAKEVTCVKQPFDFKRYVYPESDNGIKANECVNTFKVCYGHFNNTFNPSTLGSGVSNICSSLDEYSKCVATIPPDCNQYIGQPLESLNMLKTHYSEYCDPDFQKMMSCSVLTQCNRNLMGNITRSMDFEVTSMCTVLEDYFRCVDNAVNVCHLTQAGSAISFKDLGLVASRYCRTILTHGPLSNCIDLLSCHANFNMTAASPTMLIDGSYWCSYLRTALKCSRMVIIQDRCPAINKANLLQKFNHFESMTESTCNPQPMTTLPPLKMTPPIPRRDKDVPPRRAHVNSQQHNRNAAGITMSNTFVLMAAISVSTLFRRQ